ncbi:MAG: PP2C family protein-serine/threonine phosphatase [Lachnospiraceae bacterium]|nr:PP2C family protein-serine/threonine phosphatase [Lachnospiraceae bacterium]
MNKEQLRTKISDFFKNHPIFGIRLKTGLIVLVLSVAIFYVAQSLATFLHMEREIGGNVEGDFILGRIMAKSLDQELVTSIYVKGREIYDSIPEDIRSDTMNPEYLNRFNELEDDDYIKLRKLLQDLVVESDVKWIDLRIMDEETGRTIFLLDTEDRTDQKYSAGYWQETATLVHTFGEAEITSGKADYFPMVAEMIGRTEEALRVFCAYAPFYAPDGSIIGYIGVGEVLGSYTDDLARFRIIYVGIMILFVILIEIFATIIIHYLIVRPIRKLTAAAQNYNRMEDKSTNLHIFDGTRIKTHDEIRFLAGSMSDLERDISRYITDLTTVTAEKERVSAELDVGARIQRSMLPESLEGYTLDRDFEISSFIKPAKEVGGDYYDYFVIDDDHIGLVIADVSGKGVPAALFMVIVKTLIKNAGLEGISPVCVVEKVNRQLCENNSETMFASVWYGVYTVSAHRIEYVNAGHENPFVYRADTGRFEMIEEDHDPVLGFDTEITFTERVMELHPGDKFLQYTDGIPEGTRADEVLYGTDRMRDHLNSVRDRSGVELLTSLKDDVESFVEGAPQFDDMTMLLLEISPTDVQTD